jgi:hypothetical protein
MWDTVRFSEQHAYAHVIVEDVAEAGQWLLFPIMMGRPSRVAKTGAGMPVASAASRGSRTCIRRSPRGT